MNIGLKGAFLVSQACAKHIATSSGLRRQHRLDRRTQRFRSTGRRRAYSVVKAGLITLTKLQAMDGRPTASAPTRSRPATPHARHRSYVCRSGDDEGRRKGVPMGRVGSGEDIAGPAVFLVKPGCATPPAAWSAPTGRPGGRVFLECTGKAVFGRED